MNYKPYLDQNYEEIKQKCLQSGKLFKDKLFPANDSSIARIKTKQQVVWKRPHEIVDNPQFIVNSIVPNDLDQGQIGDCWLISSAAAVATVPEYIDIVIPKDQSFDKANYAGIFHFRLWRFGEWIDVVVDDFLPVYENEDQSQLMYCHNSKDTNEMFGPLLEKAFAKLNSCYEFLDGGDAVDAMIDMTGGISENFKTKQNKKSNSIGELVETTELWNILFKSFEMKSLCGSSIEVGGGKMEEIKNNGLVLGHAYGIEQAVEIYSSGSGVFDTLRNSYLEPSQPNSIKLLRMRNPWGQDDSWKGNWSKTSKSWSKVSQEVKSSLNFDQSDGEFYISLEDFCSCFDVVQFVHVNMNAFYVKSNPDADPTQYKFQLKQFDGEWIPGKNSGGCGNGDFMAYWINPQFNITLNLENNIDDKVSIIVSLIQKEQTRKRAESDGTYQNSNEAIYFAIYSVKNPNQSFKTENKKYSFKDLEEVGNSETYLYQRETCKRFDLPPGEYVIIPSTFDKDVRMKFLLRVFVESSLADIQVTELRKNIKKKTKNKEEKIQKNDEPQVIRQEISEEELNKLRENERQERLKQDRERQERERQERERQERERQEQERLERANREEIEREEQVYQEVNPEQAYQEVNPEQTYQEVNEEQEQETYEEQPSEKINQETEYTESNENPEIIEDDEYYTEEEEEQEQEQVAENDQDKKKINQKESFFDLSYHTRNFEIPKFDENLFSINVSKACSLM